MTTNTNSGGAVTPTGFPELVDDATASFAVGGRVRILRGSLQGMEGIVVGTRGGGRVRIALVTTTGPTCIEVNGSMAVSLGIQ
jgi:hypothetical protein